MFVSSYRSLGFQLTRTVRSRLSLKLSHGMSSSSGHRDIDFTLSSRGDDLWIDKTTMNPQNIIPTVTSKKAVNTTGKDEGTNMSASRKRSSSILSVRTWAKCSEWLSRFLKAMNSGIFSKAPYLYAWIMYSEVCRNKQTHGRSMSESTWWQNGHFDSVHKEQQQRTSFWFEWKNLREKLQDWEAAANWPKDSA